MFQFSVLQQTKETPDIIKSTQEDKICPCTLILVFYSFRIPQDALDSLSPEFAAVYTNLFVL